MAKVAVEKPSPAPDTVKKNSIKSRIFGPMLSKVLQQMHIFIIYTCDLLRMQRFDLDWLTPVGIDILSWLGPCLESLLISPLQGREGGKGKGKGKGGNNGGITVVCKVIFITALSGFLNFQCGAEED